MQARRYVAAPEARPLPFGLLSAALVIPDEDAHLGMGLEYETLACGSAHLTTDQCVTDAAAQEAWTSDDGKLLVRSDAFTVYSLHKCRLLGGAYQSAQEDAQARLGYGRGRAIEEGSEATALLTADDLTPTPGTAVHPLAGLAILEEYAAQNYGGVPTIHVTRGVGTLLSNGGVLDRQGARLETVQGAVVASGGGYGTTLALGADPDPAPDTRVASDAGSRWMRVSGQVVVRHGATRTTDTTIGAANPKNELSVFAYQEVVVSLECINAAVLVQAPEVVLDGGAP